MTFLLMVTRKKNGNNNVDGENDDGLDGGDGGYDASTQYDPATLLNIWRITYATGAAVLVYVLASRMRHLTESEVWAADKERRDEDRLERHRRRIDAGGGVNGASGSFEPPEVRMGPYEKQMRKAERATANNNAASSAPVISPTMSSITMKSEFELLGSTNANQCRFLFPAATEDSEEGDVGDYSRNGKEQRFPSSETRLLLRHYGVRLLGTSMSWLLWDGEFTCNSSRRRTPSNDGQSIVLYWLCVIHSSSVHHL